MSDPTYQELKAERIGTYKTAWKIFLWLGWPAVLLVLWLGGRIIDGLHGRLVALEAENKAMRSSHEAAPQK